MSDQAKKHSVIFNDNYTHDEHFEAGKPAMLTDEQYNSAKVLFCGYDPGKPLIVDAAKQDVVKPTANTDKKP